MKFALLGDDAFARPLAEAVARHADHRLTAVYEAAPVAGMVAEDASTGVPNEPELRFRDQWESLLSGAVADAVIVAGRSGLSALDRERRDDQLRKLVQAGLPLLLAQPSCDAIVAFELDMIRRDTGAVLQAFGPGIGHPAIDRLAHWAASPDESSIGRLQQLVIERTVPWSDREAAWNQLARDATLLRRIAGPLTGVSALGTSPPNALLLDLTVGIQSSTVPSVRWSLSGGAAADRCRDQLVAIGGGGQATLNLAEPAERWKLVIAGGPAADVEFAGDDDLWRQLQAFVQRVAVRQAEPPWIDICRDLDLAEMAERSLTRGRTFELYQDEPTEAGTFKGVMAAGGCLLLMLSLLVLIAAGVVEGLHLPFRHHLLWRIWPIYLVTPLVVFLLLQTLNFVAKASSAGVKSNRGNHPASPPASADNPSHDV